MDGRSPEAEESAKEWLDRARLDAENALALYDSYPSAYDNVGFLCQQATEKLLKAFLVAHSHSFVKTHDIRTLLVGHVATIDGELAIEARFADELTPYAVTARYPTGFEPVSRETAESLICTMERVWALFEPHVLETITPDDEQSRSACPEDRSECDCAEDTTDSDA